MAFVKLDCGILDSTLWLERECREVFITALLMAEPRELTAPAPQIAIGSTSATGWEVPPGWYGYVPAAGPGIVRRAGVDPKVGLAALERLGAPDPESRSKDFEGRRLVRIDGGFIVLNMQKYRDRDYTSADRQRRYRERQKARQGRKPSTELPTTPSQRDVTMSPRNITQAEVEEDLVLNGVEVNRARNPKPVDKSRSKPPARAPSTEAQPVAAILKDWKTGQGPMPPRKPNGTERFPDAHGPGWNTSTAGIELAGKHLGMERLENENDSQYAGRIEARLSLG